MVSMIAEFACQESSIKKLLGTLALMPMTPAIFWFKRNHEKGREDLNQKASQYLAIATRKTEDDNPVGSAFGTNPK